MKRKLCLALCALFAVSCCLCLAACGGETIVLDVYSQPLDIHTELQNYYLDYMFNEGYSPDADKDEVKGTADLSKPLAVTLKWTDTKNGENFTVEISETEDFAQKQTFSASTNSLDVYNLKIATTYFWKVSCGERSSAVGTFSTVENGPRNIYLDGVTNVRDFGGWMTTSGKRIKQGLLYRSARLNASYAPGKESSKTEPTEVISEITALGIQQAKALGIKTEVDFRLDNRNGYPAGVECYSMIDGVTYVALPMNGNAAATGDNAAQIKTLMEMLADESNYPLVYHCNIGTDRTGLVSYLLGALCGMSEEDLLKDYLFSNFGNIGELKSPVNSKNTFFGLNDYAGETLQQRAEAYFTSIGVSEQTYTAVRNILLGD